MIAILIIFIIITLILAYTTYNLLKKSEKLEKIAERQNEWITKFSDIIEHSSQTLEEIDYKGSFKADDEIGWFFTSVKDLQFMMSEYLKEIKP